MKTYEEFCRSVNEKIETGKRRKKAKKVLFSIVAGVCALALTVTLPIAVILASNGATTRVTLDVNPSFELEVKKNGTVSVLRSFRAEGEEIVAAAEPGRSVEETVDTLISELVDRGYLSEEANSVLVSVTGKDGDTVEKVKEEVAEAVVDALKKQDIDGAVLSQTVSADEEARLKETSDAYLLSPGRVMLIEQILAHNTLRTFDELSALTVNDLNLLRVAYQLDSAKTQSVGTAASVKYLGESAATQAVLAAAGKTDDTVAELDCRLDCVNSVMLYEVVFTADGLDWRFRVNAVTGEILYTDSHPEGSPLKEETGDTPVALVGENAVIAAALKEANVSEKQLLSLSCKGDWVDGMSVYVVGFSDSYVNAKYTFNAKTGEIVRFTKTEHPIGTPLNADLVGVFAAKEAALSVNGLVDGNVSKFVCRLTRDLKAGVYTYGIDLICAGKTYSVTVDALTGNVKENLGEAIGKDGEKAPSENPDTGAPSDER